MDNIGLFDRSQPLPPGVVLLQADGTAWMASYCLLMLSMAIELADGDPAYEDVASKFFEHFIAIVDAMNTFGGTGLWDDHDGFYYDAIQVSGHHKHLRARSMIGLIPLLAVVVLEDDVMNRLPGFKKRLDWFLENRRDLSRHITYCETGCKGGRSGQLLAIPSRERLERVLRYMLDETEFLSPYGIRSLSQYHRDQPCRVQSEFGEMQRELRSRRIDHAHVRRQLELARADLVPGQLRHHRSAGTIPLLLRRFAPRGMPNRFWPVHEFG